MSVADLHDDGLGLGEELAAEGAALAPDEHSRHQGEEIFGPVVTIQPFDTEDEVVGLVNDSPYGLNAMVFTEDLARAHRVSGRLVVGTVWVNCFFIRDLRAPFGGAKQSGVGREGGTFSREFFTEPKAIIMQMQRPAH